MSRNPIARALRVHRHKVVPDKREQSRTDEALRELNELWNQTLREDVPEEWLKLLAKLN